CLRCAPLAHNRHGGHSKDGGGFLYAHSAEVSHFDNLTFPRIEGCEVSKGIIQRDQVRSLSLEHSRGFIEVYHFGAANALCITTRAGVIYEYAPHSLRGHRIKVSAILPAHAPVFDQPHVRFVDQGRGLQRMAGTLAAHVVSSESPHLLIDEGHQVVERGLISVSPLDEQLRY